MRLLSALLLCLPFNAHADFFQLASPMSPEAAAVPPGMTLQKMVTLTTDRDATKYTMNLMLDGRAAPAGLFVETDRAQGGTPFSLADIEKPAGVVLFRAQGYDVLFLQGSLNRDTQEGRFHLKFLANGLSGEYGTCDFLLRKSADGFWVQNAYNRAKVTKIHVVTSTFGVETLEGICP